MKLANRELSWLSFNERVLQEALDEKNPLIERMRFLGIYSNNMDEFYRVRAAYVRRMIAVGKRTVLGFDGTPKQLFEAIRLVVIKQQKKFQVAYKKILKELEKENIHHINENQLSEEQKSELRAYFQLKLKHAIVPIMLNARTPFPRLKDTGIYLAIKMEREVKKKRRFALIEIPEEFPRFYRMSEDGKEYIILLDDIIRLNLDLIFSLFRYDTISAYTFKFSRDAELDLDDDISVSFMEKIQESIKKRKIGEPVRFVYDKEMPMDLLNYLLRNLKLELGVNTISGGKYHNSKDFMSFPTFERKDFVFPVRTPNVHPEFEGQRSIIRKVIRKDVLFHFPYQRFDYIVDLLREAAIDPKVRSIRMNVYRVAKQSQIMNALMNAVKNGKDVAVIVELQARFDEENNLFWTNKLQDAGAKVSFGAQELKVHSKLIQIQRTGSEGDTLITYVGTGNFHEGTATLYEDLGLLTSDDTIGLEVKAVFELLLGVNPLPNFEELLVSPFNTRKNITALIRAEIKNAKKGIPSSIKLKMNNLVDADLIRLLYDASCAGVKIDILNRGICCLVPGVKGLSENIKIRSIVGRYLEHSRFMIFENGGEPKYYITSADWMERNLDKRIEVGCPIKDPRLQKRLDDIFTILWKGNVKSRIIDERQSNRYYRNGDTRFNSQEELYQFYARLTNPPVAAES